MPPPPGAGPAGESSFCCLWSAVDSIPVLSPSEWSVVCLPGPPSFLVGSGVGSPPGEGEEGGRERGKGGRERGGGREGERGGKGGRERGGGREGEREREGERGGRKNY